MEQAEYIEDVKDLLKLEIEGYQVVKDVKNGCSFDSNIEIVDLKLDVYGPKEDLYYSTYPYLVKNVRRGNTIIKVYDEGDQKTHYYIGRKGLNKFFDMRLGFISKLERNCLDINRYGCDMH